MALGVRRKGRAYALQLLYANDLNSEAHNPGVANHYSDAFDLELDDASIAFAKELVARVTDDLAAVDEIIQGASRNWRIERMSRIDRNILRLATGELRGNGDVPMKVVINEAVELAKRFGTAESGSFVNGILDRIAQQVKG